MHTAAIRRDTIERDARVTVTPYGPGGGFPVFVQPNDAQLRSDVHAARAWFVEHRASFDALLDTHGALVLRGFPVRTTEEFGDLVAHYDSPEFGYTGGASPRGQIAGRVFESTRTPPEDLIQLHQEMAYLPTYPARVAFYCHMPSVTGGETFVGRVRHVVDALPPEFVAAVKARGVCYRRNFRDAGTTSGDVYLDALHRPWQAAFSTDDRQVPLDACHAMGLTAEWLEDGSLSTAYVSPGLVDHPRTGERIWFNQIATATIRPESIGPRFTAYQAYYDGKPTPYETTYGDGAPIPAGYLDSLYAALRAAIVCFAWSAGDVMIVDNYLAAHGRNAFTGLRDVQVALLN